MCRCYHCRKDISPRAKTCPYCGEPDPCSGGCFLTTACVDVLGKEDNCYELTTLRWFRDNYMRKSKTMIKDIEIYYNVAPNIVNAINKNKNAESKYKEIYNKWIIPSVKFIENKQYEDAYKHYKECILALSKEYNIKL